MISKTALTAKNKILRNLGGHNSRDLLEILQGHLKYDSYKENSTNILKRCIIYKDGIHNGMSFINTCVEYAQNIIKYNYKRRWIKSILIVPIYLVATILVIKGLAFKIAIMFSIGTTTILGTVESREKRNIGSVGHVQEHLGKNVVKIVKEIYQRQKSLLTNSASKRIETILKIKNQKCIESQITRYFSYISGATISGFKNVYSSAKKLSKTSSFNVALGFCTPIVPLISVQISYQATKFRHDSIKKNFLKFEQVIDCLFDPKSYQNPNDVDYNQIRKIFRQKMQTPFRSNGKAFFSGDNKTNITKIIAIPNWIGNKIRNYIPSPNNFRTEDLTKNPKNFFIPRPSLLIQTKINT